MKPKHIQLFAGMGGFGLAAEWAGYENIAHCEIDPFCQTILNYYWPFAERIGDIKKHDFKKYYGTNFILSGGFPCQGNSIAGKRLGTNDDRYLWPEMLRAVDEGQPAAIIGENVTGILSVEDQSGIWREVFPVLEGRTIVRYDDCDEYEAIYTRQTRMLVESICQDLENKGYEVQPITIPAGAVGAPHKRDRIWFLAYARSNGSYCPKNRQGMGARDNGISSGKIETEQPERCSLQSPVTSADAESHRSKQQSRRGGDGAEWRVLSKRNIEGSEPIGGSEDVADANCARFQAEGTQQQTARDQQYREFYPNATNSHEGKCQSGIQFQEQSRKSFTPTGSIENVSNSNQFNGDLSRLCAGRVPFAEKAGIWINQNDGNTNSSGWEEFYNAEESRRAGFNSWQHPTNWDNWPTQSPVCDGNDGLPPQLDRITFSSWRSESIKAGGNSVVPHIPYQFFKLFKDLIP